MLKFEMDGNSRTLESTGSLMDTIYGCCTLIRDLYFSMLRNDPDMASAFRKAIESLITDSDSFVCDKSIKADPQIDVFIHFPGNKE